MTPEMTSEQRRAVETVTGDLAISAGAGSGKTTVLAHRFAHAISAGRPGDDGVEVDRILTITFTNKAAAEIAERVRRVVSSELSAEDGRRVVEAWISTIHTFCGRLIRRHVLEAAVEPHFTQVDEVAAGLLKARAFDEAAATLLDTHEGACRLLGRVDFATVRDAVCSVHDNVRAMGADPRAIQVPDGSDELEGLVSKCRTLAEELECALGECKETEAIGRSKRRLAEWASVLSACALDEHDACERLMALGAGYDIKNLRGDAKAANDALRAAIDEMRAAACAVANADLLEGFRALTVEFAECYAQSKHDRGALDFDDLQERAVELLRTHPELARRYRHHFRLLMIDEFQDTNRLQLEVIEPLRDGDLCIVGDERQSIYGFRYADVGVFERLRTQIASKIELAENFRSHEDVLAFVNGAFSQTHLFGPAFMKLTAGRKGPPDEVFAHMAQRVECVLVDNPDNSKASAVAEEAETLASRVSELLDSGVPAGEIAVLLRNATNAAQFAGALEAAGVPTLVTAGVALFDTQEVREVMALLRTIAVPTDDERLAEVLASRLVHISDDALLALRLSAKSEPLWNALRAVGEGQPQAAVLSADDEVAARVAYRAIDELGSQQGRLSLHELVHAACEAFDYDLTLLTLGAGGLRAWGNVLKIARIAEQYEQVESSDPAAFVEYLRLRGDGANDRPAAEAGGDAVRIMTIHAAKGLEFPVVFAADLGAAKCRPPGNALLARGDGSPGGASPKLGLKLKLDDDTVAQTVLHARLSAQKTHDELEEQKRCLYVACTRAKELLVISGVSRLDKPAEESSAIIGWIREALGDPDSDGVVELGHAQAKVTIVSPPEAMPAEPSVCATVGGPLFVEPAAVVEAAPARAVPATVSYTALHTHEQCPLSHHVRYELHLGEFRGPRERRASDLGSAFHAVMEVSCGAEPAPETIEAASVRHALGEPERERLAAAIEAFGSSPLSATIADADRVECEAPIRVKLGQTALTGSIDVIAWRGSEALVLDYKTGQAPGEVSGSRAAGYELQARCYALAAFEEGATRVEAAFCFVEHDAEQIGFTYTVADAHAIRAEIEARAAAIAEQPITHLAEYDPDICRWCPALGGVCPIDPPTA